MQYRTVVTQEHKKELDPMDSESGMTFDFDDFEEANEGHDNFLSSIASKQLSVAYGYLLTNLFPVFGFVRRRFHL